MTKYFTNKFSIVNLYRKPSTKSEIYLDDLWEIFLILDEIKIGLK